MNKYFQLAWILKQLPARFSLANFSLSLVSRARNCAVLALTLYTLLPVNFVAAYDGPIHQQLTFAAVRQYNRCVVDEQKLSTLSALEARYIVKANLAESERNVFTRMFRWNYYNREDQSTRSVLGLIDTRFHDRFRQKVDAISDNLQRNNKLAQAPDGKRTQRKLASTQQKSLASLGQVLNFIQDVTSPSHAVPVYSNRWWRFSFVDKFDHFPVDIARLDRSLDNNCDFAQDPPFGFEEILVQAAAQTIDAVRSPISGYPATWESYWSIAEDAGDFGEYGDAGNQFGQRSQFKCEGQLKCLLLEDDPLYKDFAHGQHTAAVLATVRAIYSLKTMRVNE